jgi:hypothetical protein
MLYEIFAAILVLGILSIFAIASRHNDPGEHGL